MVDRFTFGDCFLEREPGYLGGKDDVYYTEEVSLKSRNAPANHSAPPADSDTIYSTYSVLEPSEDDLADEFRMQLHETLLGEITGSLGCGAKEYETYLEESRNEGVKVHYARPGIVGLMRQYPLASHIEPINYDYKVSHLLTAQNAFEFLVFLSFFFFFSSIRRRNFSSHRLRRKRKKK